MNDYWVGILASQRRSEYLREVEHAELVEEAKRAAAAGREAPPPGSAIRDPLRHRWQVAWPHLHRPSGHLHLRGG